VLVPELSQRVEVAAANTVEINQYPIVTNHTSVRSVCLEIAATRIDASAIRSKAIEVIAGAPHPTVLSTTGEASNWPCNLLPQHQFTRNGCCSSGQNGQPRFAALGSAPTFQSIDV
jgi:hypothetical protein